MKHVIVILYIYCQVLFLLCSFEFLILHCFHVAPDLLYSITFKPSIYKHTHTHGHTFIYVCFMHGMARFDSPIQLYLVLPISQYRVIM